MSPDAFYRNLPPFHDFDQITESRHYRELPKDWVIFLTDVVDSTGAIENGRYRDVNRLGAATIAAAQNAAGRMEFPYVFGGDGATLIVPPAIAASIQSALLGLRHLAADNFQLTLRIGRLTVADINQSGKRIEVARHELLPGRSLAVFRGGGLTEADRRLKEQPELYQIPDDDKKSANLDGLSCRWNAVPGRRGKVVSLLVLSRESEAAKTYENILCQIREICDGSLEEINPVNVDQMHYKSVGQCIRDEARYHESRWSPALWLRILEIIGAVLVFRFGIPPLYFNPDRYRSSMKVHADYRKFDDMLRMVIDCTPEQESALRARLEDLYRAGRIYYGLHAATSSLMTCFVNGMGDGEHIHFIDGGDGGYAMAARQLKGQLKEAGAAA